MFINPETGNVLFEGSMVFYGFRFNIHADDNDFDFDNYLINQDDALASLGCTVHPINGIVGEYCVTIEDVCSVAIPELGWTSRKFSTREISEEEALKMKEFCNFFQISYKPPSWRHALVAVTVANINHIPEAEQNKPQAEE